MKHRCTPVAPVLVNTVVASQNTACIETQCYSATLVSFPPVYYYCGGQDMTSTSLHPVFSS